jgi:hypothetical protein
MTIQPTSLKKAFNFFSFMSIRNQSRTISRLEVAGSCQKADQKALKS